MAKAVNKREMEAFLGNKLEFERKSPGGHEGFFIPSDLSVHLPGVLPPSLQHGRGDVAPHIVRQVCDFLGLKYPEFLRGKECSIGASMIFRALLWHHLMEFYREFERNAAYSKFLEHYVESAEEALPIILSVFGATKVTGDERQLAQRISLERRLAVLQPGFSGALRGRLVTFSSLLEESFGEI